MGGSIQSLPIFPTENKYACRPLALLYAPWGEAGSPGAGDEEYVGKPLLDGSVRVGNRWNEGKYELAAFVRNMRNKVVLVSAIDFNNMTGVVSEPRIVGVQFKATFLK